MNLHCVKIKFSFFNYQFRKFEKYSYYEFYIIYNIIFNFGIIYNQSKNLLKRLKIYN